MSASRPPRQRVWVLLALGLAVVVVGGAAFYPWMPSGVVVKGQIEPAELRKVYGAISKAQADHRRETLRQLGFGTSLIAHLQDDLSKVVAVEASSSSRVLVSVVSSNKRVTQRYVAYRHFGKWNGLFVDEK